MKTHYTVKITAQIKAGSKEKAEDYIRKLMRSVYITPIKIEFEDLSTVDPVDVV